MLRVSSRIFFPHRICIEGRGERAAASCLMARIVVDDVEMELMLSLPLSQPVADLELSWNCSTSHLE